MGDKMGGSKIFQKEMKWGGGSGVGCSTQSNLETLLAVYKTCEHWVKLLTRNTLLCYIKSSIQQISTFTGCLSVIFLL